MHHLVTFICTLAHDGACMIPACELYRTLDQAQCRTLDREYIKGIACWITSVRVHESQMYRIDPRAQADIF